MYTSYLFQHGDGIRTLKIQIKSGSYMPATIWEFKSKLDFWEFGSVEISANPGFKLTVVAERGDSGTGWIAIDDFVFISDYGLCRNRVGVSLFCCSLTPHCPA